MNVGKIIKFFREKANLTQEQLGNGICSVTHVSKIERGITEYSSEITTLLAKRLGINIQEEVERLKGIEKHLHRLHNSIIMQKLEEAEATINELEECSILYASDYQDQFHLLKARYYLLQGNVEQAKKLILPIQKNQSKLPLYEINLLKHVLGIYYILKKDYFQAIDVLKTINTDHYHNLEYYYNLAFAYHSIDSKILAYYYAEKVLEYFKSMNNFVRVIDTETVMLVQIGDNEYLNFQDTIAKYESLIQTCETFHFHDKKAKLLHNWAYNHYRRGELIEAQQIYYKAMQSWEKNSSFFLLSFSGYIRSSNEGDLLEKNKLMKLVDEGMSLAKHSNEPLYSILFTLLYYEIEDHISLYPYINEIAIPFFKQNGQFWLSEQYEKRLFSHYSHTQQIDKAITVAQSLIKI
ncbi:helix-turn-helix domain-containing protein [Neobacillus massiliamazoniensis]|uniref:Transcriptional regulator/TPR domain protein n=1 Tax=Neobacillus massiliamazoniensis TaxID=1499688 RepID=A0A0U1NSW4_9BACI|nr:helix-turn-helix transcriptional regulator [Neobacillus massiliamazoniensis]CRK80822.1 transcriptional regulator/TPR domain protein [Neobacillus massiliamazoniensis]